MTRQDSSPSPAPEGGYSSADALDGAVRLARLRSRMFARVEPPKIGDFNLLRRIGSGGMGVVYAAWDPALDRIAAVKVLRDTRSKEAAERLQREAVLLAKLRHPNVVGVYAVGTHEGQIYLAMEYVEGETLRDWVMKWQAQPTRDMAALVEVFEQAAQGLAAAHDAGLVHRDVKPENMMIGSDGRLRLMDFGLARVDVTSAELTASVQQHCEDPDTSLATSTMFGTPAYMAPEQLMAHPIGAAADQYAFMLCLYEALCGRMPHVGPDRLALAMRRSTERVEVVAKHAIPRRVRALIQRGLSIEPTDRLPSMHVVAEALGPAFVPRRVRPWHLALGAGLFGGGVVWAGTPTAPPSVCTDSAASLGEAWSESRRVEVAGRLGPGAPQNRVLEQLDLYADDWRAAHRDACTATRVTKSQSEDLLDLRMRCLSQARVKFDAATRALSSLDGGATARLTAAVRLGHDLVPVARCADLEALRTTTGPLDDPERRKTADELRQRLAYVVARRVAGQDVAVELTTLLDEGQALGHDPLLAEIELEFAEFLARWGTDLDAAREHALRALDLAETSRHDIAALQAWIFLTFNAGHRESAPELLQVYARRALAAWERAGAKPLQRAVLDRHVGSAWRSLGDTERAREHLERAVALVEQHGHDDGLELPNALVSLGLVLSDVGESDAAYAAISRALPIYERAYGLDHPALLPALLGLAGSRELSEDVDAAQPYIRRARSIVKRLELEGTPMGTNVAIREVATLLNSDRAARAVVVAQETVAALEASGLAESTQMADMQSLLGASLYRSGRCDEAIPVLNASVSLCTKLGAGVTEVTARNARASCVLQRDPSAALPDIDRVLALLREQGATQTISYALAMLTSARARKTTDRATARKHLAIARELAGDNILFLDTIRELEVELASTSSVAPG